MKQLLNAQNEQIAWGESFEFVGDAWVDSYGTKYPLSVTGEGCTVADYTPPAPAPEPPAPELRYITKLAFRNRFTTAEKVAIELAGVHNPADTVQKQQLAATVRASDKDVQASSYIDLGRPETRAGVEAMEAFGLLAAGRANEILDAPVQDFERYRG